LVSAPYGDLEEFAVDNFNLLRCHFIFLHRRMYRQKRYIAGEGSWEELLSLWEVE
jgi:hypothetical protein